MCFTSFELPEQCLTCIKVNDTTLSCSLLLHTDYDLYHFTINSSNCKLGCNTCCTVKITNCNVCPWLCALAQWKEWPSAQVFLSAIQSMHMYHSLPQQVQHGKTFNLSFENFRTASNCTSKTISIAKSISICHLKI